MNGRPDQSEHVEAALAESDEQLLARFVRRRDEQAFADLVARHAALVMGVCRRLLYDSNDADDAFQATFLVLAMRAASIRRRSALPAWLYGVAYRTARRLASRRRAVQTEPLPDDLAGDGDPLVELTARHDRQIFDEELNRLPARYRDPLVLHYLLGKPHGQVAELLGETPAAIDGRLKRARRQLRIRLAARGVSLVGALAAVAICRAEAAGLAGELIVATSKAGMALAQGAGPSAGTAVELAKQELSAMTVAATSKTTALIAATCAALAIGLTGFAILSAGQQPAARSAQPMALEIPSARAADQSRPLQVAQATEAADPANTTSNEGPVDGAAAAELVKYLSTDYKLRTPQEQKILSALDSDTRAEFIETPLSDVIHYLKDLHSIPIVIDHRELDSVGIGSDTPITFNMSGASLRNILTLMLQQLDLDYVTHTGVLQITTARAAERLLDTRVYELRRLKGFTPEQVAETIRATIRPRSWDTQDDAPAPAVVPLGGALVVTQSQRAHGQIVELLEQLERYNENPLYK